MVLKTGSLEGRVGSANIGGDVLGSLGAQFLWWRNRISQLGQTDFVVRNAGSKVVCNASIAEHVFLKTYCISLLLRVVVSAAGLAFGFEGLDDALVLPAELMGQTTNFTVLQELVRKGEILCNFTRIQYRIQYKDPSKKGMVRNVVERARLARAYLSSTHIHDFPYMLWLN